MDHGPTQPELFHGLLQTFQPFATTHETVDDQLGQWAARCFMSGHL
jgi:hypothetical protein